MFERFTERARQVVVLAQNEARAVQHDSISDGHLLIALVHEEEGIAARVLEAHKIATVHVRDKVRGASPQAEWVPNPIPFTPRAKNVLELAMREALSLGFNYIGTEHILLGLLREVDGDAVRILHELDADPERIRHDVLRKLEGQVRTPRPA